MLPRNAALVLYHVLLDFVFPPVCFVCRQMMYAERGLVCRNCWKLLPRLQQPVATVGSLPVASVWQYSEELHQIVHGMKYHHRKSLAVKIGLAMAELAAELRLQAQYDFLVPVPLHPVRRRERGYNQSALLTQVVSERTGIQTLTGSLKRNKYTRAQAKLGKQERLRNIREAFTCPYTGQLKDRKVIIVDDVVTTGATLNACASVLITGGAREVLGLTAARTIKNQRLSR